MKKNLKLILCITIVNVLMSFVLSECFANGNYIGFENNTEKSEGKVIALASLESEHSNCNLRTMAQDKSHPEYDLFRSSEGGQELISERDSHSRIFQNTDGSFTKRQGTMPVHYRQDGKWLSYRNELDKIEDNVFGIIHTDLPIFVNVKDGETHINLSSTGDFISFGTNSVIEFFDSNGKKMQYERANFNGEFEQIDNSVQLKNIWDNTDRRQVFNYYEVKTDYIIKEKPASLVEDGTVIITENFSIPDRWSIIEGEGQGSNYGWQGELLLLNEHDEIKAVFHMPVFYDSNASRSYDDQVIKGTYQYKESQGLVELSVIVPMNWLNASHRKFPVVIDPIVSNTLAQYGSTKGYGFDAACQQTLAVNVPAGIVTNTNTEYFIQALNGGWMVEQRSRVGYNGNWSATQDGQGGSEGSYFYSLTDLNIANGVHAGGNLTYVWQAYRTWDSDDLDVCDQYNQRRVNDWIVYVTYFPSCQGHCGGSAGGCWCDNLCWKFNDCCPDVCDYCPPGPAEISSITSVPICTSETLTIQFSSDVSCSGTDGGSFMLTGPYGEHHILNVYSDWCVAQGTAVGSYFDNIWVIELSDYLIYEGEYTLTNINGTVINGCGVMNTANSVTFNVTGISANIEVIHDYICFEDQSGELRANITNGLTGGPYTYNWEGDYYSNTVTINETSHTVTDLHPGVYHLTISNAAGCTWIGNQTVVGAPPINANASSNSPVCEGETVIIMSISDTGVSYEWSGPDGWTSDQQNPTRPNATIGMAGEYSLVVTDTHGCSVVIDGPLVVNASPSFVASNSGSYCPGESIELFAGNVPGATYSWSGPEGFTSPDQNPVIANSTTAMSGVYSVEATNSDNCSTIETTNVTVYASVIGTPLDVQASPDIMCIGEDVILSANPGDHGEEVYWYTGSCGGTLIGTGNSITVNPLNNTVYYARSYDSHCGYFSGGCSSIAVTVDQMPVVSAGGTQYVCENGSVQINGVTVSNGTILWTHDGNGILTDETSLSPTYSASNLDIGGNVTLTITVTSNNSCNPQTAQDIQTIIVEELPMANVSGTETICAGSSFMVETASFENGSINWTHNGNGSITDENTLNPSYHAVASDGGNSVTLTLTVTSDNACAPQTDEAEFILAVDPLPSAIAGGMGSICAHDSHVVLGAIAEFGTVLWTHDGDGSITDEISLEPTYIASADDAGTTVTLTMTVTGEGTCLTETDSDTYIINIMDYPQTPTFATSDNNNFCEDFSETINLSTVGGMGDVLNWYADACGDSHVGAGNPLNIPAPDIPTTYFASYQNSCGISECAQVHIHVAEPPIIPDYAESDIDDFCSDHDGNIELSVVGGHGSTVQWFTGSCGGSSIGIGNPLIIASPAVTTTYYARRENSCGVTECVSLTVTVQPIPQTPTSAEVDINDICADSGAEINLSVTGGAGNEVHWFRGSCGGDFVGIGNPLSIDAPDFTTTYYARWENDCGISACASVVVNIIQLPVAPNFVSSDQNNLCFDDPGTVNLTAAGGSGDDLFWYSDACGDNFIGTGNPLNIASPSVTTQYFARWENVCGESDCESTTINIFTEAIAPDFAQVDIDTVCSDNTVDIELSIEGGVGTSVHWYRNSCGETLVGIGNPLVIESPLVTRTYFARYESSCGITECVDVTVTVISAPQPPTAALVDTNNVCSDYEGEINLTLEGGNGEHVIWFTGSCGGDFVGSGNPLAISVPENTTTFYGRWENYCGITICQNITLTVIPAANPTINPVGPFCETDGPVVITAAQPGGVWGGSGIDPNTGFFNPQVAGIGEHLITYTIEGQCGNSDEITISVIENFNPTIDELDDMCSDDEIITLSAADNGGVWSGDGIVDANQGLFDPSVAGAGNHIITYSFEGNCGASDNITITVIQRSDASIDPAGPFCKTDMPVVLSAAQTGGTWAGNGVTPNTGFFDPQTAGPGEHTITYTIDGLCGDSDEIVISVLENLNPTIVPVDNLCSDDEVIQLSAANPGGIWSGNGIVDETEGLFDASVAGAGNHTITYTIPGPCGGTNNITITVIQRTDATINSAGPYCETDGPEVITAAQSGGEWGGAGINSATGFFQPEIAGIGDHIITYTIDGYCGSSDQVTISVIQNFNASIISHLVYCVDDDPVFFDAEMIGGVWIGDGVDSVSGHFDPMEVEPGLFEIIYSYDGLCGSSDTVFVSVYDRNDATIITNGPFFEDETEIQFIAQELGGEWIGNAIETDGIFYPYNAGIGEHEIIYIIEGVCGDSDTVYIEVIKLPIPDLLIPTVFSPNNDGFNDTWNILGLQAYNNVMLKIYTRWGDEVFAFEGSGDQYSSNHSNHWDGKYKGRDLPAGSYLFVIVLDGDETYKGTISLIR